MPRFSPRAPRALALAAGLIVAAATALPAQYFGQNKVQYEHRDFDVLRTAHFDLHYYDPMGLAAQDAARMMERWNARLSPLLNHPLRARKPVVLYADQPDFQQTNVISGQLDESTGGVTESLLDRMTLPLTSSYAESDHVIGHEMVHVFQYDMAQRVGDREQALSRLPLWLVEGMAEYLSVGPRDAHTAMWLRDATRRSDIPSIKQLTDGRKYFPYRYGEALWAYIGGTWGDDAVPRLFRASLQYGWDDAVRRTLGMTSDSLSRRWKAAIIQRYASVMDGRSAPRASGEMIAFGKDEPGQYNVSPTVSPDGRTLAYFTSDGLRGITLVLADAQTGRRLGTLAAPGIDQHFDALSFLYSAGAWSPDAGRIAIVTYASGDNEIDVVDVARKKVIRRYRPASVGAITTLAWSPDGRSIAFSGQQGGPSDLYLLDVASGAVRRLTNDRHADLQPQWSPDGRTIAFASDRSTTDPEATEPGSDFTRLSYGPLRLSLLDVATGEIRVLPGLPGGKHVDPQWAPDGRSLYFVSDWDGFSDVYRTVVATGETFRVTRVATGVSGVTASSPAISVARGTGRLFFTVFDHAGFHVAALRAEQAQGEAIAASVASAVAGDSSARLLPMDSPVGSFQPGGSVARYLADADGGLPADSTIANRAQDYTPALRLAYVGRPSLGASFGGVMGTQLYGSGSMYFSDILGDHALGVGVQAAGQLRDIGGVVQYLNTGSRLNWGAMLSRTPYVYGYGGYTNTGVQYLMYHIAVDNASLITQYPLSQTRRLELGGGLTRYSYGVEQIDLSYTGSRPRRTELDAPSALNLGEGSLAYVGDDASFGFTSPFAGTRYRLEVAPTLGTLQFNTLLADYRKYLFLNPVTLAVRGLHYGRYGKDADSDRLGSLFLGDGALVRGYSYNSYTQADCAAAGTGALAGSSCPAFDRLLGSRLAVASAELRVPVIGMGGLGLLQSMHFPPVELAAFADAGAAWRSDSPLATWNVGTVSNDRTPVASVGLASRVNLFGFAVLEMYYAHPFQREGRSGVWGFQLQPGW